MERTTRKQSNQWKRHNDEEKSAQPQSQNTMIKTCRRIVSTLHDPTADITRALTQYKYILTQYKAGSTMWTDEARDYIRDRFLEDSCVMLMKRETFNCNDWDMADTITDCCKLLVSIAVPLIKDDSLLAMQIIYHCMNPENAFFRHYGHDWRQRRGIVIDEDQEDPSNVYAVYRGRLNSHSFHLVDIVNEFGRCGGFDAIIERLQNRDKNIPVRNLRHVISPLSKCYKMYGAETAAKFIPQLCELTFETLSSLTVVELRDLRKDFLERIISSVVVLLRRHKSGEEIAKIVEELQMKMALRRLKCATIERRVDGIQYIADVCSRTRRHHDHYYTVRYYTPERLMQWIEESELLALLFGFRSHPELMKQSADVLKFIYNERKLSLAHLDIIWAAVQRAASKQDDVENELETLCSVIESIAFHLDQPHFDFMFDKFEGIEKQTFTAHHLQLMCSLSQSNAKHTSPPQRCLDLLWDIVQDESGCTEEIVEQAKGLINECLARLFSQKLRIPTMNKCISNIKQHKSVCVSLQLLVKIIELYPIQSHMSNEPGRWTIIGHLEDNSKVLEHFFNDLEQFKTTAQQKIVNSGVINDVETGNNDAAINNLYVTQFSNSKKYLEEIEERLLFVQYIVSNSHIIKFSEHYADILWTSFIVNALSMKERELTLRTFRHMVVAEACRDEQVQKKSTELVNKIGYHKICNRDQLSSISLNATDERKDVDDDDDAMDAAQDFTAVMNVKTECDALKLERDALQQQASELEKRLKSMSSEKEKLRSSLEMIKNERDALKSEQKSLKQQLEPLKVYADHPDFEALNQQELTAMEKKLKDKLKSIKEAIDENKTVCIVCHDALRNHVLVPCGHLCVCGECKKHYEGVDAECPICRAKVSLVMRTINS